MKWILKIALFAVALYALYIFISSYIGPLAIRPGPGQVHDPLLAPLLQQYADAVDAKKGSLQERLSLGMAYEAAELYVLAEQTYGQLVELTPNEPISWYRLAVVQERQGDLHKAIASLFEASMRTPEGMASPFLQLALWYLDVGNVELAKANVNKALLILPTAPQLVIAQVRIALAENNPEDAVRLLTKNGVMQTIPNNYGWQLLGRAYRTQGKIELAREAWGRAGSSRPRWGDPWSGEVAGYVAGLREMKQRIGSLAKEGSIEQAQKLIQEYYTYKSDDLVINRIDAMCDLRQGNFQGAMQKLATLLQNNPSDTFTKLVYAQSRMKLPLLRSNYELLKTKKLVEEVLLDQPNSSRAHLLLGNIYVLRDDMANAVEAFHTCLKLDPNNKLALQNALLALQKTNAWDAYDDIVAIGMKLTPNHPLLKNRNRAQE
jgi:tetratricopeptide (TPR) repeat protein